MNRYYKLICLLLVAAACQANSGAADLAAPVDLAAATDGGRMCRGSDPLVRLPCGAMATCPLYAWCDTSDPAAPLCRCGSVHYAAGFDPYCSCSGAAIPQFPGCREGPVGCP